MSDVTEQRAVDAVARIRMWDASIPPSRIYPGVADPIEAANNDAWDAARWLGQRLADGAAERQERAKPITAEWLESIGFSDAEINGWSMPLDCKQGSVVEMFIDDEMGASLGQDEHDVVVLTSCGPLRNRGQLLDLVAALKGGGK